MSADTPTPPRSASADDQEPTSKKDQILALHDAGVDTVEELALLTRSRPSYVGTVLQEAGRGEGYLDLYTSTSRPMNVYSRHFEGVLGFRDVEAAQASVATIDRLHRQFAIAEDRAGQHHALLMALTMYDRARWTDKTEEAEPFRQWLMGQIGIAPADAPVDESEDVDPASLAG